MTIIIHLSISKEKINEKEVLHQKNKVFKIKFQEEF